MLRTIALYILLREAGAQCESRESLFRLLPAPITITAPGLDRFLGGEVDVRV